MKEFNGNRFTVSITPTGGKTYFRVKERTGFFATSRDPKIAKSLEVKTRLEAEGKVPAGTVGRFVDDYSSQRLKAEAEAGNPCAIAEIDSGERRTITVNANGLVVNPDQLEGSDRAGRY